MKTEWINADGLYHYFGITSEFGEMLYRTHRVESLLLQGSGDTPNLRLWRLSSVLKYIDHYVADEEAEQQAQIDDLIRIGALDPKYRD
jgi:hypothetical protein